MKRLIIFSILILSQNLFADSLDCSNWPSNMAFVYLKNAGLIISKQVDHEKTEAIQLASEQLERDLYRQVYLIKFIEKSGKTIEVVTVNQASSEECSMSEVGVFVID